MSYGWDRGREKTTPGRPSIRYFRSTGLCCGPRAIGSILAATLGDGAAGLSALKQCGGITVVQDPSDAAIPEMPTTALTRLEPDHVVGLAGMPRVETLTEIHRQPCSITRPLRRALMSAWGSKAEAAAFPSTSAGTQRRTRSRGRALRRGRAHCFYRSNHLNERR